MGGSYDPAHPQFSPLKLKSGKWAEGPDQVVVDAGTAAKQHYEIGDPITVSTLGTKHAFELTGVVKYGDVDSLGFASIAAWDLKTAQKLLHREGASTRSRSPPKGTSAAELVRARRGRSSRRAAGQGQRQAGRRTRPRSSTAACRS